MSDTMQQIADRVRGVAAQRRMNQQRIAGLLRLSRTSVSERLNGRVPFTAVEIHTLAAHLACDISHFFPPTTPAEGAANPDPQRALGGGSSSAPAA